MPETLSSAPVSSSPRRLKLRKAAWIGVGALGFFLAFALVTPHFIDLGLFKRTYLPFLEEALGRRIDVGEVYLNLIPTPSIRLSRLKVSNGAALADNVFFSAEQVRLKLRVLPLLSRRFEITELVLDKPIFNLRKPADGSLIDPDIAAKKAPAHGRPDVKKKLETAKTAEAAVVPLILPNLLRVRDGELRLGSDSFTPVNIKGIDLRIREFAGTVPFPFRLAFDYPGLTKVTLEGKIDYQEEKALLELLNNRLTIQGLTFPVQGNIANLTTAPRINLSLGGEGIEIKSVVQILASLGLTPPAIELSGPMGLYMNIAGPSHSLVSRVRGRFHDIKVQSRRAVRGKFSGEVELRLPFGTGPLPRRLQGNGKLVARDGELTHAGLIKKVQRVTGMIGFSKAQRNEITTFQRLETDFNLRGGLADISRIYLVNPQLEARGSGTLTLEQPTLDIAISATLSPQASAHAARARATAHLKNSQGRVVVPLKIAGPMENPAVNLNSEKLVENGLPRSAEKNLSALFKGLFRDR
jgi:uncharacterized protein involved in outer membrane biogenesis